MQSRIGKGACALLACALLFGALPATRIHAATKPEHAGASLSVDIIAQLPQLPNGCEATSAAMLLGYMGYDADKMELAYDYLPREDFSLRSGTLYGADPAQSYPGDPGTSNGYYCYPQPLVQAVNTYLEQQQDGRRALDFSGVGEEDLLALLDAGCPVIVWKTIDNLAPRSSARRGWRLYESGEKYDPLVNVHVLVLCGYDDESFLLADPLQRENSISRELFMQRYSEMGSHAVAAPEAGDNILPELDKASA